MVVMILAHASALGMHRGGGAEQAQIENALYDEHCADIKSEKVSRIEADFCRCSAFNITKVGSAKTCVEEWVEARLEFVGSCSNATMVSQFLRLFAAWKV